MTGTVLCYSLHLLLTWRSEVVLDGDTSELERSHLRLAAYCALMKMERYAHLDAVVPPVVFRVVAMGVQVVLAVFVLVRRSHAGLQDEFFEVRCRVIQAIVDGLSKGYSLCLALRLGITRICVRQPQGEVYCCSVPVSD